MPTNNIYAITIATMELAAKIYGRIADIVSQSGTYLCEMGFIVISVYVSPSIDFVQ